MKKKNLVKTTFTTIGFLGLILYIFGIQFNGTLCDDIQTAGMSGMAIFAIWAVINIAESFSKQKELENM